MIDELQLGTLINKCKHLKYKFADTFMQQIIPPHYKEWQLYHCQFSKATQTGTHWLLLCNRNNKYLFADPVGLPLNSYPHVRNRLSFADLGMTEIIQAPLQNFSSNLCGLYCIYIAQYVFDADFPLIPYISEQELLRFVKHFI